MCKSLNCYIYTYGSNMPNPSLVYIYGYHIYIYSLYLANYMHYIICIYDYGHIARYCPISLLSSARKVALDFMKKNRAKYQVLR